MRRLTRRLALPIVGVLWITVLLFFWVTKKKLDVPPGPEVQTPKISEADWDDVWDRFDERPYLNAKKWRVGDDPYKLYAFNQRESERIASNRAVPDTRHSSAFNQRIYMLPSSWWLASPLPSSSYQGSIPGPMAFGPH
ncbi:Polypeptide N-Acetylgalactosaminyltransferase 14 [Manis pentadactyla]|nr:Polypeptide N-Acetylgalactosaminyltransferase 14 [Manis pentadactyla]